MKNEEGSAISIGKLSKLSGATLRTIRYYTELGLVSPCGKTQGGQALFGEDSLSIMRRIRGMQEAGLSLTDISEVFGAIAKQRTTQKELTLFLRQTVMEKRDCIYKKECELGQLRKELDRVLEKTGRCDTCGGQGEEKDCKGCGNLKLLETLGVAT